MSHSEERSKRELMEQQSSFKNQNGSQTPLTRQPARGPSLDPYEDDPSFHSALRLFQSGKMVAAMSLVDKLVEKYPGYDNLEKFKARIQQQLPEESSLYRDHPAYLTLRQSMKEGKWDTALQAADTLLMSYPNTQAITDVRYGLLKRVRRKESRARLRLMSTVVFLSIVLMGMAYVVVRYLREPTSLAEIFIPEAGLSIPPHFLFAIQGADQPVGVGMSPDGERLYVTEMGGSRMVRIFDRTGQSLGAFTSPKTEAGERAPVYVATDSSGRVYVSDRLQHAIFVYSADGDYIETLLGPNLTLSEYVAGHAGDQAGLDNLDYNLFKEPIFVTLSRGVEQNTEQPELPLWSPLGIRFGQDDRLLLTDVTKNNNRVIEISLADEVTAPEWIDFDPPVAQFGWSGSGNGEMLFPNSAVADSLGRVYVSDGNNRRISVWDNEGNFLFNFGGGTGAGSLSLPRGLFIDGHDRLYIVDTVAQNVKVYDASGSRPEFLFEFGEFGKGAGGFNYPNDITVDRSGRLYIADRENNRIEVWSY